MRHHEALCEARSAVCTDKQPCIMWVNYQMIDGWGEARWEITPLNVAGPEGLHRHCIMHYDESTPMHVRLQYPPEMK